MSINEHETHDELIARAQQQAIAWFERETARLRAEIEQIEAQVAAYKARQPVPAEKAESEAGE